MEVNVAKNKCKCLYEIISLTLLHLNPSEIGSIHFCFQMRNVFVVINMIELNF